MTSGSPMNSQRPVPRALSGSPASWLSIDEPDEDSPVWVQVIGGAASNRAEELWSALESALQEAVGRMVVIDLSAVSVFDTGTVEAIYTIARTVRRWHIDMCAVVAHGSALTHYLRCYAVDKLIPLYPSARAFQTATKSADIDDADSPLMSYA